MSASSSSSFIISAYAPTPISVRYRILLAGDGDEVQRLNRYVAFARAVCGYTSALLISELLASDYKNLPEGVGDLLFKLGKGKPTSSGDWSKAAQAAANALRGARSLTSASLSTAFWAALQRSVETRNASAHATGGRMAVSPEEAASTMAELEGDLRTIVRELEFLRRYPLLVAEDVSDERPRGGFTAKVHRIAGPGVVTHDAVHFTSRPKSGRPFVVDIEKPHRPLYLLPLIAVHRFTGDAYEARLLEKVTEKGFQYDDPRGGDRVHLEPNEARGRLPVEDWLSLSPSWLRPAEGLSASTFESICGPSSVTTPTVEGFEDLQLVGSGGCGRVFRAKESGSGRVRALKILHSTVALDEGQRERLRRENQITQGLHHPGIVESELRSSPEVGPYLVMEWVDGMDLEERLTHGRMSPVDVVPLCRELLSILRAVHAAGVVHRDIKPANIRIDSEGRARLLDFGVARDSSASRLTRAHDAVGTMEFAAPEQLRGEEVGPAADLYSLAKVALACLTAGARPRPDPRYVRGGLAAVLRRAVSMERSQRYVNASDFDEALATCLDGSDCPVLPGYVAQGCFRVAEAPQEAPGLPGLWMARGAETTSQEDVSLFIAVDDSDAHHSLVALLAHLRGAGRLLSHGYRAALHTSDGLFVCVTGGRDPRLAWARLARSAGDGPSLRKIREGSRLRIPLPTEFFVELELLPPTRRPLLDLDSIPRGMGVEGRRGFALQIATMIEAALEFDQDAEPLDEAGAKKLLGRRWTNVWQERGVSPFEGERLRQAAEESLAVLLDQSPLDDRLAVGHLGPLLLLLRWLVAGAHPELEWFPLLRERDHDDGWGLSVHNGESWPLGDPELEPDRIEPDPHPMAGEADDAARETARWRAKNDHLGDLMERVQGPETVEWTRAPVVPGFGRILGAALAWGGDHSVLLFCQHQGHEWVAQVAHRLGAKRIWIAAGDDAGWYVRTEGDISEAPPVLGFTLAPAPDRDPLLSVDLDELQRQLDDL